LGRAGTNFKHAPINGQTDKKDHSILDLSIAGKKNGRYVDATLQLSKTHPNRAVLKIRYSKSESMNINGRKSNIKLPVPSTWQMKRVN
jgi:hypothetical protein